MHSRRYRSDVREQRQQLIIGHGGQDRFEPEPEGLHQQCRVVVHAVSQSTPVLHGHPASAVLARLTYESLSLLLDVLAFGVESFEFMNKWVT